MLTRMYFDVAVKLRTDQKVGRQVYLVAPCIDAEQVSSIAENQFNGRLICRQMAGALGANGTVIVVDSVDADPHFSEAEIVSFSSAENYMTEIDHVSKIMELSGEKLQEKVIVEHSDHVTNASFSSDGKYLVTASDDKTAKLWKLSGN